MTVTIGRRELLAALGGAAASWPLAAHTQRQRKVAVTPKTKTPANGWQSRGSPVALVPDAVEKLMKAPHLKR